MLLTSDDFIPFPVFCFFWYMVDVGLSLANYVAWVRFNDDMFGSHVRRWYLAFVIFGMIVYAFPAAYAFMKVSISLRNRAIAGGEERMDILPSERKYLLAGIAILYLSSDFPLFFLDFHIVYEYGYHTQIQSLDFVVKLVSWAIGSITVWVSFMWYAASCLQDRNGGKGARRGGAQAPGAQTPSLAGRNTSTPAFPQSTTPGPRILSNTNPQFNPGQSSMFGAHPPPFTPVPAQHPAHKSPSPPLPDYSRNAHANQIYRQGPNEGKMSPSGFGGYGGGYPPKGDSPPYGAMPPRNGPHGGHSPPMVI